MVNYFQFWDKLGHQIRAVFYGIDDFFSGTGLDDIASGLNFTAQQNHVTHMKRSINFVS
jgi:hypothetical protein